MLFISSIYGKLELLELLLCVRICVFSHSLSFKYSLQKSGTEAVEHFKIFLCQHFLIRTCITATRIVFLFKPLNDNALN